MKKLDSFKLFFATIIIAVSTLAQDRIILRNGDLVEAVVLEVGVNEIKYKRWSNTGGPYFFVSVSDVLSIIYSNGEKDVFQAKPQTQYNNQTMQNTPADYNNFTGGQRWGTWGLNYLLPGLGSYVIMKDKAGGTTNLVTGIAGYTCMIVGLANFYDYSYDYYGYYDYYLNPAGVTFAIIGWTSLGFQFVYNIVRSASYNKPQQKYAKGFNPSNIYLSLMPTETGENKFELSYKVKF